MSSQIKPVQVRDDILMCSDQIAYAVEKGGQNVSVQRFNATSVSPNSHTYTIQVPSHNVVLSRELLWHSRVSITLTGVPVAGKYLVNYGQNGSGLIVVPQNPNNTALTPKNTNSDCLAPFPLHQAVQNMTCQINNTSVNMNTNQLLDPLLRCMNRKQLARWNSTTPVYLDNYGSYGGLTSAQELKLNSPFNGYDCVFDPDYPNRGSFSVVSITGNTIGDGNAVKNVVVVFDVSEPIMLSPFIFGDVNHTSAGIYGVSQLNFTMQMDPTAKRMWRFTNDTNYYPTAPAAGGKVVSAVNYDNTKSYIECRFLTPHPSTLLPELNVVPLATFTNYVKTGEAFNNGEVLTNIQSDNIQLNSVPDKVIVYIKESQGTQRNSSADCYASINSINITFNNQTGILSNSTPQELWRMSQEAGSNQSWLEFSGLVQSQQAGGTSGGSNSSTGSVLVLDFAEHIQLSEEYYAPSSIGQFNFNIQVNATNHADPMTKLELNVVFLSSGVFTTQNGISNAYTGVLTKQMVLDASLQEPLAHNDVRRYVGGGFFDTLKSAVGKVLPFVGKIARPLLGEIDHPVAKFASEGLKSLGFGQTGGAMTAGRMKKHLM